MPRIICTTSHGDSPIPAEPKDGKKEKPEVKDQLVVIQHKITVGGVELNYTLTTSTVVFKEETDRDKDYEGETAVIIGRLSPGEAVIVKIHDESELAIAPTHKWISLSCTASP